jgi:hypothetical protein
MTGDCHVRFYERRRVRLPPATHQGRTDSMVTVCPIEAAGLLRHWTELLHYTQLMPP